MSRAVTSKVNSIFLFMEEIWKDIPNYEGMYQISNLGRVKSLSNNNSKKEKILKQYIDKYNYYNISLNKKNIGSTLKVHKLIAMAFLNHTPCGYKEIVDHIDNNPLNNNVNNLQLITQRLNCSKDKKNKSSKYTGVYWSKRDKIWRSQISINGKLKNLGRFNTEIEAHEAYKNELKIVSLT